MFIKPDFWKGKRVLLTGHTGFKGAWTALFLEYLGAQVSGISLPPSTDPNLFEILFPQGLTQFGDIRDKKKLEEKIESIDPEIVFHMAAQPLVLESYRDPYTTMETNIMGTVNLLEVLRKAPHLAAILIITTDKVYLNQNDPIALSESSPLGGDDPYSASKAAVELITASYAQSFFHPRDVPVCTARAGNVIGGGDWSKDRIIPDLWRAYLADMSLSIRRPQAVRPWQHVLDPIYGYLLYVQSMIEPFSEIPHSLNFGPSTATIRTVLDVAKSFASLFNASNLYTVAGSDPRFSESEFLSIDPSLAKRTLGWRSILDVDTAILWSCEWYKAFQQKEEMRTFSLNQIRAYLEKVEVSAKKDRKKFLDTKVVCAR